MRILAPTLQNEIAGNSAANMYKYTTTADTAKIRCCFYDSAVTRKIQNSS